MPELNFPAVFEVTLLACLLALVQKDSENYSLSDFQISNWRVSILPISVLLASSMQFDLSRV